MTDEKTLTIAEAMAKVHEKLVQPKKDKENPFFKSKYVPLENVVEAIDNAIKGTGLAYMQLPFSTDDGVGVKTIVMTKDEKIESDLVLPSKKVDAQAYGSVITYARRYALSAFFGITSDEDDDGNEATKQTSGQANRRTQSKPANKPSEINIKRNSIIEETKAISDVMGNKPGDVLNQAKIGANIPKEKQWADLTLHDTTQIIVALKNIRKTVGASHA